MAARILEGIRINEGEGSGAVFYDSTVQRAYGPVFENAEEAERFLTYLAGVEPGILDWGTNLAVGERLYSSWLKDDKPAKRPVVQLDKDYLYKVGADEEEWNFSADLVETCFPLFNGSSNHDVGKILQKAGVIEGQPDTEHSCVYAHFKTEAEGQAFLERLNAWLRDNWHKAYPEG